MSATKSHRNRNLVVTGGVLLVGILAGVLLTAKLNWTESSTAQGVAGPVNVGYNAVSAPLVNNDGESPFVAVAERVSPTVVNITSDRKITFGGGDMPDLFRDSPFWEWFHPRGQGEGDQENTPRPHSKKKEYHSPATGSGIIISRDGYILTNNHVVEDADKLSVKVLDGKEYVATVVGADPETDVAVIKVDHMFDATAVALIGDSEKLRIGDWAIAMGNPLGLDWTLTVGVISAEGRSNLAIQGGGPAYQNFIQTDASINFGNSGGPLCNIHGEVIGVNTAINPSGQGIGFAIPINMAMKVVKQLRENGAVARGYLGIRPAPLTDDIRSAIGFPENGKGIWVDMVEKGKPADEGGLRDGDVITKFNGKDVDDVDKFRMLVADHTPGQKVNCDIWRSGDNRSLTFTLGDRAKLATFLGKGGEKPESQKTDEKWLGITVEPVTEQLAEALELDGTFGVVVTDVDADGKAAEKLQERDVIIEIDRKTVDSVSDFRDIASSLKDANKAVLFRIIRGGVKTFVAIDTK
ncbi:Do family serine endopeptidase [candidate division KSB1 bacterium]|nr:Do family serine endopeptidase [candidate division KSB1 bacterium]